MKKPIVNGFHPSEVALFEAMGEEHHSTSLDTPMLPNAFERSDEEKIDLIADHFKSIMDILNTVIALLGLLATVIIGTAKITWTIAQVIFRNTHHAKHYSKK